MQRTGQGMCMETGSLRAFLDSDKRHGAGIEDMDTFEQYSIHSAFNLLGKIQRSRRFITTIHGNRLLFELGKKGKTYGERAATKAGRAALVTILLTIAIVW